MPFKTLKNPYKGINAHLHSEAQNPGDSPTIWTSVHASHIGHITDALNAHLSLNYVARQEQSLQIWVEDTGEELVMARPKPDVGLYRTGAQASRSTESIGVIAEDPSARVISIQDMLDDGEVSMTGIAIYEVRDHNPLGHPVTRIELLSRSNKRGGSGHMGYLQNRLNALLSGTSLIELDFLHETPSPLPYIPIGDYTLASSITVKWGCEKLKKPSQVLVGGHLLARIQRSHTYLESRG